MERERERWREKERVSFVSRCSCRGGADDGRRVYALVMSCPGADPDLKPPQSSPSSSALQVNSQLRQQARSTTLYAPGLSYVPQGGGALGGADDSGGSVATLSSPPSSPPPAAVVAVPIPSAAAVVSSEDDVASTSESAADTGETREAGRDAAMVEMSMDGDAPDPCRAALREGKTLLRANKGPQAMTRFERALLLSRQSGNLTQERRATRGLAAGCKMTGSPQRAIGHLERVLELSRQMGDHVGDADAYGVIADCYTELNDYELAGESGGSGGGGGGGGGGAIEGTPAASSSSPGRRGPAPVRPVPPHLVPPSSVSPAGEYYDKYIAAMETDGPV